MPWLKFRLCVHPQSAAVLLTFYAFYRKVNISAVYCWHLCQLMDWWHFPLAKIMITDKKQSTLDLRSPTISIKLLTQAHFQSKYPLWPLQQEQQIHWALANVRNSHSVLQQYRTKWNLNFFYSTNNISNVWRSSPTDQQFTSANIEQNVTSLSWVNKPSSRTFCQAENIRALCWIDGV